MPTMLPHLNIYVADKPLRQQARSYRDLQRSKKSLAIPTADMRH